ncbi:glycosyltransferase family 39 protein, partial [bacterium]|nr:glycosyltransferase family 39 protein [bacterium]
MMGIKDIKPARFYLAGLTLLALSLRLFRLGFRSIWLDEAYSLKLASADWQGIVQGAAMDIHPPLFHILLGGWIRIFGTSEYALRSLSALMGALLIPVIFKLVAAMINRRAAWFTAGLATLSPYFIELSRSGRMAGLLALLAVLSWYFFWRFINDGKIWSIIGYGAAILAALYTHYFGFLVLLAQHLYIFMGIGKLKLSRKKRKAWMLIQMFLLFGYAPWLSIFWEHLSHGGPSWRGAGALWLEPLHSLYVFMVGTSCWTLVDKILAGSLLLAAAITAGVYLIPQWRDWYGVMLPRAWGLILTGIFLPLGLVWAYSINKINVFDNRYL